MQRLSEPYRIALLSKYSTPPRTLRMAKILADAGHSVHIIEWDRTGQKPRTEIKNGIVFKRLKFKATYGVRTIYALPVWTIFALIQTITGNYHAIQPQNLDCMIPTFFATKLRKHARVIYDLADFYSDAYIVGIPVISRTANLLEKLLIRRTDALIMVSERQILQVETKNLPSKVVIFYNAPDANFQTSAKSARTTKNKNENVFTLFYPGELSYDRMKLLMNVIKAVKGLPIKIEIAGFGEYDQQLRRMSETNKQLAFLGFLSHEKTIELTKKADLILLPYDSSYINNRIGLPNKFFETMACGNTVLAPKNTYMGEIVEKEKIGIVVDYNNPTEIRHALTSLIASERGATQLLKEKAKKLYMEKYNPQKIDSNYLMTVESLVSK